MRFNPLKFFLLLLVSFCSIVTIAQVNLKPLEQKGFATKSKLKPFKRTNDQILLLKIRNTNPTNQRLNFQLFFFVDGVADSMSKVKEVCLAPGKKAKYRFLFKPETQGMYSVGFDRLKVEEVDSCN